MGNYDHLPKGQAINLEYGAKIRSIRGLRGSVKHQCASAFSQDEKDLIDTICDDAEQRAKETWEHDTQSNAEASGGTSTEPRQYSGK